MTKTILVSLYIEDGVMSQSCAASRLAAMRWAAKIPDIACQPCMHMHA
jgi:hypothetical protein